MRYCTIQQIKPLCPSLGKGKIAHMMARAGIHIGKKTVGRIIKEKPIDAPEPPNGDSGKQCRIVSKYPGHTWRADLAAVPTSGGFRTHWIPNAIWQRWPVCWWVLNVIDHYSRRSMGFAVFNQRQFEYEVACIIDWYNEARPHMMLELCWQLEMAVELDRNVLENQMSVERQVRRSENPKLQVEIECFCQTPL